MQRSETAPFAPGRVRRTGRWQRARRGVAVAAAVAAGVAGCGGGGTGGGQARTTLTIATPGFPPSLDPATGANENSDHFNLAYDPLIVQAPDGSFTPGLAERWSYGPRNESFTITLRSGVRFSDGTPLDAEAVKQWIDHALTLPGGRATTYLKSLRSVDVDDPRTVRLNFSRPTPLLELTFSQILGMGLIGSPAAVKSGTLSTMTAGTGPYMLDPSATVARDHYTYVPNPHHYDKARVRWKKIVIKTMASPTAALQALRTGQVQVAKDQPVASLDPARKAGLKHVEPLTLLLGLSLMDRDGKVARPLADVRVRQAINHAIDRKALAAVVGAGHGRATAQMAAPGDDSYDEALDRNYPYDVAKAKGLLAEAGYGGGFELRTVSVAAVGQDRLAQALAGQLEKVGIRLKLDVKANVSDYMKDLSSGTYRPGRSVSAGSPLRSSIRCSGAPTRLCSIRTRRRTRGSRRSTASSPRPRPRRCRASRGGCRPRRSPRHGSRRWWPRRWWYSTVRR